MLSNLLAWLIKATNIRPKYTSEHCLAVTRATGGCDLCAQACPHQAITITRTVDIDDIDCTGCGLCVQACPSQALQPVNNYQAGAALKCSKVKGGANTVVCLGRLQASDIVALAGTADDVSLVHADCAHCTVGTEKVLERLQDNVQAARELFALLGKQSQVTDSDHTHVGESDTVTLRVLKRKHFDAVDNPAVIDRRELLRGGWRNVQQGAADALAPLERFAQDESQTAHSVPLEHQKRLYLLRLADMEPDQLVPFALPRVADGCIMCPKCTNVCPTQAFERVFDGEDERLMLRAEYCNGCAACVTSCPKEVITLDHMVPFQDVQSEPHVVFQRQRSSQHTGVSRSL